MTSYSIGEVESITGIKAHILRYWEEVIPGFAPKKDLGGRRTYTQREVDSIVRMKFLIYEKKFTIEGARDQLIAETRVVDKTAQTLQDIHDLRNELTELYLSVRKYRRPAQTKDTQ
jgi:DNA-binding transcriptional MerR regulator